MKLLSPSHCEVILNKSIYRGKVVVIERLGPNNCVAVTFAGTFWVCWRFTELQSGTIAIGHYLEVSDIKKQAKSTDAIPVRHYANLDVEPKVIHVLEIAKIKPTRTIMEGIPEFKGA